MGKLDISAKKWEKNPAMLRIIRMFEDAFNSVGEKIRADLLKAYREHARENFDAFMTAAGTRDGEISPREERFPEFKGWSRYVKIDRAGLAGSLSAYPHTWTEIRSLKARLSVDYEEAEKNANYSYENARDSFVHKNIGKISNVLGARQDLKNAVMKFDWRGNYFKGNLQVYLEGAYFRGDVDIKYVIRRIPNVTPYFQYPLVFVEAEVAGKHYARPSEDELRVLLGATKSAAEEKREEAVAAGICPMSGKYVPEALMKGLYNRMSIYVKCPGCGAVVSVQKGSWKFRNHKTPGAERAGAAAKLETAGYCPTSGQTAPYHLFEKLLRSYKTYPGGQEKTEYDVPLFDSSGKSRRLPCETCGQSVVISDIRGAYSPEKVRVIYRKHKLPGAK
jgi:endogenous inhibitor of DNA gyrase (YacG/DUF329 family)